MAYWDFKDLAASNKALRDKAFEIASNSKYDGYQGNLASMVYNFFDEKSTGNGMKNQITQNQQLAEELHKPIVRKFQKEKFIHHLKTIFGMLI